MTLFVEENVMNTLPSSRDISQRQCWTFSTVSQPPSQTHHFWTILEVVSATVRTVEIQVLLQLDSTMYLLISHPQMCEYQTVTSPTTVQQKILCFEHQVRRFQVGYSVEGEEH